MLRPEATDRADSPKESREAEELLGKREEDASKNLSSERLPRGGLPPPFPLFFTSCTPSLLH
jgi:hypothetical protein